MMSKAVIKSGLNFIGLLLLLAFVILPIGCEAESVRPELELSGSTTIDGVIAIRWPNTSIEFTGKEIENKLGLQEGDLKLEQNVRSKISGLPVVDWYCRCDGVDVRHRFHVTTIIEQNKMNVSLRDSVTGKILQKRIQLTPEMEAAINDVTTVYELKKNALLIPGKGGLDLGRVLKGGAWLRSNVEFDGYEGVIEWRCERPDSSVKPRYASCYCSGSDSDLDNPECWGFRRNASVAFRMTDNDSVELFVFETNFSTVDEDIAEFLPNMMIKRNAAPKVRTFTLQSQR